VNTSVLAEKLAQLNAQIEPVRQRHAALEGELRLVAAELETFSADKERFDALRDVCNALDKLGTLGAGRLFWDELLPDGTFVAGHLNRQRQRIAGFEAEIRGTQEKHGALQAQVDRCRDELSFLYEEEDTAHAREERRKEEYVIEREISPVPDHALIMPWSKESESERRFRRALLVALSFFFVFGTLIPLLHLPVLDRSAVVVVPKRLASMLKKAPPKPEVEAQHERRQEDKKIAKTHDKVLAKAQEERAKATIVETPTARKTAESTGVLAFKESFKDLMDETPVARLGAEARLTDPSAAAAGQAQASRALVSMPATGGSSGGIGNAGVSRNLGGGNGGGSGNASGNRLGGVKVAHVESTVAGLTEEARPLSSGVGPARTDEEIQIVFDKYKATLYRIYNAELRKNPTLRGKMIMRLTIEPAGEVSACAVQSTDLASAELVVQIVDRVKRFNFGPKENVPSTTILYPIDFLPAG
jgi:hypothetical protein